MTLNQIAINVGNTGFMFKSTVTGKKFKVMSVTPAGKFLAVNVAEGTNEVLLDGQADRYEVVSAGLSPGQIRLAAANAEVNALYDQQEEVQSQIDVLEREIDELESDEA